MNDPSPAANLCAFPSKIKKLSHHHPLARSIAEQVCEAHGVRFQDVLAVCREQPIVEARRAVMAALRDSGRFSYPEIAKLMQRDHTTVMYDVRRHHG